MDYTIISIDDSRQQKKDYIRACLGQYNEVKIDFVNGKNPSELLAAKNKWRDVETPGPFKAGEFGIFYSVLNCLEYGAENNGIIYFEDDAIPIPTLEEKLNQYFAGLPRGWDVFAIWSPENQQYDYANVISYNNVGEPIYGNGNSFVFEFGHSELSMLWQGYGNVAMAFSRNGCRKLLKYIKHRGFFSPIDCLICIAVHGGYLKGFSLKPDQRIINYDWSAETTIHTSAWGSIQELTGDLNV